ncbi:sulfotransferase 1C2-like isoform X1 [Mytilus californianus]|uniref:sulfotransferase 1C2-like isoform X1 n=1 Tax=Mytilus californianus TaxID=6549 RepID=UPI002247A6DB|nr:sulfotransferase 1C2-like isoform X1 [Mytilus californianus]
MADAHDVPLKLHNESVIDSDLVIYPFTRLGEETFLSGPLITEHGIEKYLETVRTLKTKDTDIILCTTMKSGTHWCHEILSMLLSQSLEYNTKGALHHMLLDVNAHFFDKLDEVDDPRLFTTHLPLHHLPTHHVKNGYKIIYVNRNPKDRWASNYTFLHGKLGIPDWTWDEFYDNMILKDDFFGGWFNFTREFEKAVQTKTANILPVKYEDLKLHPFSTIEKMAEFINVSHSEDFIRDITEKCSFDNIKKHKFDSSRIIDPKHESTLFRKGLIGDWKNWFTVAQNEKFDEMYREEMKNCDVNFIYEH